MFGSFWIAYCEEQEDAERQAKETGFEPLPMATYHQLRRPLTTAELDALT